MGQSKVQNYGYPLIQNFTNKQYPAENVNWGAAQDELGNLYFANNNGVLKYDGNYWTLIETSKQALSISYDSITKSIFVGCVDDFGFIEIKKSGKLIYQSLASRINKKDKIGNVWDCISTPEGIYFNTQKELIRFKNGAFKIWQSKNDFHAAFYTGGKIFIRETGVGLLYLNDGLLNFVRGSEVFAENNIAFLGNIKSSPDKYIVASRELGIMKFSLKEVNKEYSIELSPSNKNALALFDNNHIYKGISLTDNNIALATQLGGLIIVDENGNLKTQLNLKNGLFCDVINSVFEDKQGNLWLTTDNGISLIMYSLPITNFQNSGNVGGIVESISKIGKSLFVGTSNGIYKLNSALNQFEKLKFPTIQVFQLTAIEEEKVLLAATKNGIYRIEENGSFKLILNEVQDVLTINKSKRNKNILYVGHGSGFAVYKYINGGFSLVNTMSSIKYSIRSIAEDYSGNIWLSTEYDGIICVFNANNDILTNLKLANYVNFTTDNGLFDMKGNFAFEVNKKILVNTLEGVYRLNIDKDISTYSLTELAKTQFVKDFSIDPYSKGDVHQIKKIKFDEEHRPWFFTLLPDVKFDFGMIEANKNGIKLLNKPFKIISNNTINEFYLDSSYIWVGGTDMIHCYNKTRKYDFDYSFNSLISSVSSNNDTIFTGNYYSKVAMGDSLVNQLSLIQPTELIKSFSYQNNDLTFQLAATSYIADNPCKFSCYLEGEDEKWSEWSNQPFKTYMNLNEGKYIFKVKAKNIFDTESTISSYEFVILPPWYRTKLAYFLYVILSIAFIAGVVKFFTTNLNRIIKKQTAELQQQKDEILHKNKEITDSIYYAKRIQDAIMPSNEYIKNMFEDSFVLFKPKDIVSGDFYWANLRDNNAILAAVDCTGHGVPGAFMSMMGNDYLNDIIVDSKINEPNEILNRMRKGIIKALKQRGESGESKDGMDMSLVNIDKSTLLMSYAGANNPIYVVRDKNQVGINNAVLFNIENSKKNLYEIKGNKFPVGIHMGTALQDFTKHEIQLVKGDVFYMFSDGYADQFGGPSAKKLKYNQFKKFILESMFLTMEEQRIYLEQKLNEWQGDLEQVDDVLVIGVRIV